MLVRTNCGCRREENPQVCQERAKSLVSEAVIALLGETAMLVSALVSSFPFRKSFFPSQHPVSMPSWRSHDLYVRRSTFGFSGGGGGICPDCVRVISYGDNCDLRFTTGVHQGGFRLHTYATYVRRAPVFVLSYK